MTDFYGRDLDFIVISSKVVSRRLSPPEVKES